MTNEALKIERTKRYQAELDNYFAKCNDSPSLLGELYERYIGYKLEMQGYSVEYHGIQCKKHHQPDNGIDLIGRHGKYTIIVQCKYRTDIDGAFQGGVIRDLFGAWYIYKQDHQNENVSGRFVTTGILSDDADNVAKKLHMRLMGLEYMPKVFPIIKCKTNAGSKALYYLPTDSQYDDIMLNLGQGDFYCQTVAEAEAKNFRRVVLYTKKPPRGLNRHEIIKRIQHSIDWNTNNFEQQEKLRRINNEQA